MATVCCLHFKQARVQASAAHIRSSAHVLSPVARSMKAAKEIKSDRCTAFGCFDRRHARQSLALPRACDSARSPWRAHVACVIRAQWRKAFERMQTYWKGASYYFESIHKQVHAHTVTWAQKPEAYNCAANMQRHDTHTAGYLRFHPMAQCAVHALKGLACRARVTPASSPSSHCKQCSALTSPSLHARGCARPSRTR
jgi:hypothetical protein